MTMERDGGGVPAVPAPSADALPPAGPRSRWRRWVVPGLAGGLVLVLGLVSLVGLRVLGVWTPRSPGPAAEATAGPGMPAPPSPFAGTPAAGFAEGAAGIVLPPVEPVGDFTADYVAEALTQVRQALVAARLAPGMLVDHDPGPLVGLVADAQQPAMREAFDSATFATFATQVADGAVLMPAPPRVAGEISYRATTAERDLPVLEVVSNFVWVYAFQPPDAARAGATIVVVRDALRWEGRYDRAWLESSRGMWLADAASYGWGVDCDAYQKGLIRPGRFADPAQHVAVAFDPERPLPSGDGC